MCLGLPPQFLKQAAQKSEYADFLKPVPEVMAIFEIKLDDFIKDTEFRYKSLTTWKQHRQPIFMAILKGYGELNKLKEARKLALVGKFEIFGDLCAYYGFSPKTLSQFFGYDCTYNVIQQMFYRNKKQALIVVLGAAEMRKQAELKQAA